MSRLVIDTVPVSSDAVYVFTVVWLMKQPQKSKVTLQFFVFQSDLPVSDVSNTAVELDTGVNPFCDLKRGTRPICPLIWKSNALKETLKHYIDGQSTNRH